MSGGVGPFPEPFPPPRVRARRTLLWEARRDELRLREERGDRRREPDHLGAAVVEHPVRGEGSVEADLAVEVGENTNIKNARHYETLYYFDTTQRGK